MSSVVKPMTFPYKPNGGFTPDEIWGPPKPSFDPTLPAAETLESRKRWEDLFFNTTQDLLNAAKDRYKVKPGFGPGANTNIRDPNIYPNDSEFVPSATIHITGEGAKEKPNYAFLGIIGASIALLFVLSKVGK